MHDDKQRWAGDKNQLQGPETDMGDGEKMIITNIGATRLPVIAVKILLLISPHPLSSYHINKDTKNKDHREPDAAKIHGDRRHQGRCKLALMRSWVQHAEPHFIFLRVRIINQ
uniref:Uncharacterized protein n=1 Tax=Laticauda laticaudata TaxID=8630 RepID=A0A8C5S5F8_LATLA